MVAEVEQGLEVRFHAAWAAAALAGPDKVVEFACFGAFALIFALCCDLSLMDGGRGGDGTFEGGDLLF